MNAPPIASAEVLARVSADFKHVKDVQLAIDNYVVRCTTPWNIALELTEYSIELLSDCCRDALVQAKTGGAACIVCNAPVTALHLFFDVASWQEPVQALQAFIDEVYGPLQAVVVASEVEQELLTLRRAFADGGESKRVPAP